MATKRDKPNASYLDGGVPVGSDPIEKTKGNVYTPVSGFANDAGAGVPPPAGMYGAVADGEIPSSAKDKPVHSEPFDSFFGSKPASGRGSR
jgi:hypothetical protein